MEDGRMGEFTDGLTDDYINGGMDRWLDRWWFGWRNREMSA
jgi:hypothetical protein